MDKVQKMVGRKIGIGFESRMFKNKEVDYKTLMEALGKSVDGIKDKYWVAYTVSKESVQKISQLLFKTYNVEDKGHDMTK